MPEDNVPDLTPAMNSSNPRPNPALQTIDDYLQLLAPETLTGLSSAQLMDIRRVIGLALPSPAPKVLDVRFGINLLFARYFVVFFMGKERRKSARPRGLSWIGRLVNGAIAICLVLSINLFVTFSLAIALYLVKSALGIDLFDNQNLPDFIG